MRTRPSLPLTHAAVLIEGHPNLPVVMVMPVDITRGYADGIWRACAQAQDKDPRDKILRQPPPQSPTSDHLLASWDTGRGYVGLYAMSTWIVSGYGRRWSRPEAASNMRNL